MVGEGHGMLNFLLAEFYPSMAAKSNPCTNIIDASNASFIQLPTNSIKHLLD